ncbi:F-box/kelch-repeat protein At1g57790-like [Carex rostrata]
MPKRKRTTVTTGEGSGTDGVCIDRNWSELPKDILHLFYKNLPDITDFIRFRAVCKSWRLSAPVNDYPPQLPWLLEHREHPEKHHENAIIRFYCLSSGKVHTVTCPGSRRARLEGPACRYLLASHTKSFQMYLLNPLTNDQIYAPWVNVFGYPVYIGPDPIKGGDIVVISPPNKMMAFWRLDADDWVYVGGVGNSANAFYRGQYFSHD